MIGELSPKALTLFCALNFLLLFICFIIFGILNRKIDNRRGMRGPAGPPGPRGAPCISGVTQTVSDNTDIDSD